MSKLVECPLCHRRQRKVFTVSFMLNGRHEVYSKDSGGHWVDCPLCLAAGRVLPELAAAYTLLKPGHGILSIDEIKELILAVGGD